MKGFIFRAIALILLLWQGQGTAIAGTSCAQNVGGGILQPGTIVTTCMGPRGYPVYVQIGQYQYWLDHVRDTLHQGADGKPLYRTLEFDGHVLLPHQAWTYSAVVLAGLPVVGEKGSAWINLLWLREMTELAVTNARWRGGSGVGLQDNIANLTVTVTANGHPV